MHGTDQKVTAGIIMDPHVAGGARVTTYDLSCGTEATPIISILSCIRPKLLP
jgi:hypothetical protein